MTNEERAKLAELLNGLESKEPLESVVKWSIAQNPIADILDTILVKETEGDEYYFRETLTDKEAVKLLEDHTKSMMAWVFDANLILLKIESTFNQAEATQHDSTKSQE